MTVANVLLVMGKLQGPLGNPTEFTERTYRPRAETLTPSYRSATDQAATLRPRETTSSTFRSYPNS